MLAAPEADEATAPLDEDDATEEEAALAKTMGATAGPVTTTLRRARS